MGAIQVVDEHGRIVEHVEEVAVEAQSHAEAENRREPDPQTTQAQATGSA